MAKENGTDGLDYLSLDGIVTEETKAWDGERSSLPPGDYCGRITDVEKSTSSNNKPQLVVSFEVTQGEQKGRKMRNWYSLTQAAIGRFVNLLDAVGLKLDGKNGFSPLALKGKELVFGVYEDIQESGETNPMTGQPKPGRTFYKVYKERPMKAWAAIEAAKKQPAGSARA